MLTGLSWAAVILFCLIPFSFCIAYSLRFAPSVAWMWLSEVAVDLLLGWLGLNFVSLFASLLAGYAYVKLYPCFTKLSNKLCCKPKKCCSKSATRVARVTPYHSKNYGDKNIPKPANIKLKTSAAWSTPKHKSAQKADSSSSSSSDDEIEITKEHSSSMWATPKDHVSPESDDSSSDSEIETKKSHPSSAWSTNPKKNYNRDDQRSSSTERETKSMHSSATSGNVSDSTSSDDEHENVRRVLLTRGSSVEI